MTRSSRAVHALAETDPQFAELVGILYGDDVDPDEVWSDVFKASPGTSDLATSDVERRNRMQARVGLASNVLGITAGTAALGVAARDPRLAGSAAGRAVMRGGERVGRLVPSKLNHAVRNNPGKAAAGALGLQAANVVGDGVANRVLSRAAKDPKNRNVEKSDIPKLPKLRQLIRGTTAGQAALIPTDHPQMSGVINAGRKAASNDPDKIAGSVKGAAPAAAAKPPAAAAAAPPAAGPTPTGASAPANGRQLRSAQGLAQGSVPPPPPGAASAAAGATGRQKGRSPITTGLAAGAVGFAGTGAAYAGAKRRGQNADAGPDYYGYAKRDDAPPAVSWEGTFAKFDDDKRLAFGYASVVSIGGQPVIDRQGDLIDIEDIEKAAYDYVQRSRKGGGMHWRDDNDEAVHISDLVESFVITDEKVEKMGLPPETPRGWWVGFKVNDDDAWTKVRKGEWTGFSIHGRGKRIEKSLDEALGYR